MKMGSYIEARDYHLRLDMVSVFLRTPMKMRFTLDFGKITITKEKAD